MAELAEFVYAGSASSAGQGNTKGDIGATIFVSVSPQFPHRQLMDHGTLLTRFTTHHITWRQTGFPASNSPKTSAHESLLIPGGAFRFSLVEITVWGHLFYAIELEDLHQDDKGAEQARGIHSNAIVGYLFIPGTREQCAQGAGV